MEIETKLNIDSEAYFVENDGIRKGDVVKIEIFAEPDHLGGTDTSIWYTILKDGKAKRLNEVFVFASLEETLRYLERKFYVEEKE